MNKDKKPDSVVYNEDSEQFDAFLKPYSTSVSAPVIEPTDLTGWKQKGAHSVNARFQARIDELKTAYQKMMKELEDNQKVYQASFKFEPVIGKIYHHITIQSAGYSYRFYPLKNVNLTLKEATGSMPIKPVLE